MISDKTTLGREGAPLSEPDAEAVQQKFGEFAETYATAREEAAALSGSKTAADQWHRAAEEIKADDDKGGSDQS